MALKDNFREGVTRRKVILESISGSSIREASQLGQLADFLGSRRGTLLDSSKRRLSAEDQQKLIPLVEMLGRKPPEGERVLTLHWKIQAGKFFELDTSSDVVKGTHAIYKVRYYPFKIIKY